MEQFTKPTTPETFTFKLDSKSFMKRMYPTAGLLFFISFLLFGAILNAIGLKTGTLFAAIFVAAAFTFFMIKLKEKQFDSQWAEAHIVASPEGITSHEKYRTVTIKWSDIEQIGQGDFMRGARVVPGDTARGINNFVDATASRQNDALIGSGTMTIAENTPSLMKTTIEQNLAAGPKDAAGNPKASIVIGMYEENWRSGQLGIWLKAYRPDLFGTGTTQGDGAVIR